jgi:hypothetical protein
LRATRTAAGRSRRFPQLVARQQLFDNLIVGCRSGLNHIDGFVHVRIESLFACGDRSHTKFAQSIAELPPDEFDATPKLFNSLDGRRNCLIETINDWQKGFQRVGQDKFSCLLAIVRSARSIIL